MLFDRVSVDEQIIDDLIAKFREELSYHDFRFYTDISQLPKYPEYPLITFVTRMVSPSKYATEWNMSNCGNVLFSIEFHIILLTDSNTPEDTAIREFKRFREEIALFIQENPLDEINCNIVNYNLVGENTYIKSPKVKIDEADQALANEEGLTFIIDYGVNR